MKLDSKYFDMVRIRPRQPAEELPRRDGPKCQWKGCGGTASHRAPKGRGHDGQYFAFCTDHVRKYNSSYNYFDGMSDSQVEDFQRDATYGHRPTWRMSANAWGPEAAKTGRAAREPQAAGAAGGEPAQGFHAWRARQARADARTPQRKAKPLERKALETLGLDERAQRADIKAQFKALVKRHHPDANGGDRASEEKLREIIQAYNYLKQVGLV